MGSWKHPISDRNLAPQMQAGVITGDFWLHSLNSVIQNNSSFHYGNQSWGYLFGGRPLWPPAVPRLAARSSQSNPRGSGPEVLKRERGHVTAETGVAEVGVFRALQHNDLFQQPTHQTMLFLDIFQSRQYNCCNQFPSKPFKLIISFKHFQPTLLSISFFCEIFLNQPHFVTI